MQFTVESILLALFTGVIAGFSAYIASYMKAKGELKAATEGLARSIVNEVSRMSALENEKLKIATQGAIASETRKCVYALVVGCQSLLHSMCWLAWHAKAHNKIPDNLVESYDEEAHKLLPEIMAQQAVLAHLDYGLFTASRECVSKVFQLDVAFGDVITMAKEDQSLAVLKFRDLHANANYLIDQLSTTFSQVKVATVKSNEEFEKADDIDNISAPHRTVTRFNI